MIHKVEEEILNFFRLENANSSNVPPHSKNSKNSGWDPAEKSTTSVWLENVPKIT
jgi:hypothetical protein